MSPDLSPIWEAAAARHEEEWKEFGETITRPDRLSIGGTWCHTNILPASPGLVKANRFVGEARIVWTNRW